MVRSKKVVLSLFCWVSLLALLVSCAAPVAPGSAPAGEAAQNTGGGGEIVMWRFPLMDDQEQETKTWDGLIASFKESHPDVNITIETQPWDDRRQKLLSAIGSGRGCTGAERLGIVPSHVTVHPPPVVEWSAFRSC